jgi:predicted nucleic acid-binding protein
MVRTQIYLTKKERDSLTALAKATGKRQSELIREAVDLLIEQSDSQLSAVVIAEVSAGARHDRERENLDGSLAAFRVVPVTAEIAREGGLLRSRFGKSHGVGLADALLAATALHEHAELATLNVKHYPMIKGLRPAYSRGLKTTG